MKMSNFAMNCCLILNVLVMRFTHRGRASSKCKIELSNLDFRQFLATNCLRKKKFSGTKMLFFRNIGVIIKLNQLMEYLPTIWYRVCTQKYCIAYTPTFPLSHHASPLGHFHFQKDKKSLVEMKNARRGKFLRH